MVAAAWGVAGVLWIVAGCLMVKSELDQRRAWREYVELRDLLRVVLADAIEERTRAIEEATR